MTLAALSFTVMVGLVKLVRSELGPFEIVFWRGAVAVPMMAWMARSAGYHLVNRRLFLLRLFLGFGTMAGFFTAVKGLPLADMSLISKLQPILMAFIAPWFLGDSERSGPVLWVLLAAGLLGCGLIIGPELAFGTRWGLIALGATLTAAGAHTCVRGLARTDAPMVQVFWFQIGVTILGGVAALATTGLSVPPTHLWLPLAGVGFMATLGQIFMTSAYEKERAALAAAASYTAPVWAALGDLLVFGHLPSVWAVLGGVVIVGSGFVLLLPEGIAPRGLSRDPTR